MTTRVLSPALLVLVVAIVALPAAPMALAGTTGAPATASADAAGLSADRVDTNVTDQEEAGTDEVDQAEEVVDEETAADEGASEGGESDDSDESSTDGDDGDERGGTERATTSQDRESEGTAADGDDGERRTTETATEATSTETEVADEADSERTSESGPAAAEDDSPESSSGSVEDDAPSGEDAETSTDTEEQPDSDGDGRPSTETIDSTEAGADHRDEADPPTASAPTTPTETDTDTEPASPNSAKSDPGEGAETATGTATEPTAEPSTLPDADGSGEDSSDESRSSGDGANDSTPTSESSTPTPTVTPAPATTVASSTTAEDSETPRPPPTPTDTPTDALGTPDIDSEAPLPSDPQNRTADQTPAEPDEPVGDGATSTASESNSVVRTVSNSTGAVDDVDGSDAPIQNDPPSGQLEEPVTSTTGAVDDTASETRPSEDDLTNTTGVGDVTTDPVAETDVSDAEVLDPATSDLEGSTGTVDETLDVPGDSVDGLAASGADTIGTVDATADGTTSTLDRTGTGAITTLGDPVDETVGETTSTLDRAIDGSTSGTGVPDLRATLSEDGGTLSVSDDLVAADASISTVATTDDASTDVRSGIVSGVPDEPTAVDQPVRSSGRLEGGSPAWVDDSDVPSEGSIGGLADQSNAPDRWEVAEQTVADAVDGRAGDGPPERKVHPRSFGRSYGVDEGPAAATDEPVALSDGEDPPTVGYRGRPPSGAYRSDVLDASPAVVRGAAVDRARPYPATPSGSDTPLSDGPTAIAIAGAVAASAILVSSETGSTVLATMSSSLQAQIRTTAQVARTWAYRVPRGLPIPGYSRYDDSDPLVNDQRAHLYEELTATPGASLGTLIEGTDVSRSSARYHLRILEHEDMVSSAKVFGKRRFYPADVDDHALQAALCDETTRVVLEAIGRHEPASGATLTDALDRDPSTVTHHLKRLAEAGLVERQRDGRAVVNRLSPVARSTLGRAAADADPGTADQAAPPSD